jgi:hypothetical protein
MISFSRSVDWGRGNFVARREADGRTEQMSHKKYSRFVLFSCGRLLLLYRSSLRNIYDRRSVMDFLTKQT